MNERIKELNLQAMSIVMNGNDPDGDIEQMYIPSEFTKKFAELIVKECCDIVLAPHNETGFTISMDLCKFSTRQAIDRAAQSEGLKVHTQGISKEIKQHFGVEE